MKQMSPQMKTMIGDFRAVKPTKADQRNNPDIDVMAAWLDDIEHTIKCKSMDEATAAAFRAAINAASTSTTTGNFSFTTGEHS